MNLEVNQSRHGFKLIRKETVEEIQSEALIFKHEKNGAELIILENDDDNKVFSVTFRTPPSNDFGVPHILEHSVLCGSKKYPVKEPFVELMKGSLQTFLNAMTFPDKTMYPIASRNQKDFFNLMSVYLDAVFYPNITKETFMQEGWHYELEDVGSEMVYKGVVFNEMKGVFSSPEGVLDRHLAHSLFPNTTYGCESGGDPKSIPNLTFEEFKEFHKQYYHPSNSRIFLYGDGNTEDYLKFLNDEYLKDFDSQEVNSTIQLQKKFTDTERQEIFYPVSKEETLEKKTFIVLGLKLGSSTDSEHCLSMEILSHILIGTSASPLRKALLESELGSEVIGGGFDDNRLETIFAVGLKGTEKEHETKIIDLILSTLQGLVENGIDKNQIKSSVNTIDFKLREANFGGFPKGIVYNIHALGSWLYEGDPLSHLRYEELMANIKVQAEENYFEDLISKFILNNTHRSIIVLSPKPGLAEEEESEAKNILKGIKDSLSNQELENVVEETKRLQALQMAVDPPEKLATLPRLELNDVNKQAPLYPGEIKKENSPKILLHDLFTNKIAYTQMCFNARQVPKDKIQYLPLLGRLITGMGTNKRDYVGMSQHIGIHTGGISSSHFSSVTMKDRDEILSFVNFNGTALMEKADELFDIYSELFLERNFGNYKRLQEIIRSAKANMEASIVPSGNQYVLTRLQAYHSQIGRYNEITEGITFYLFLENLLERVEKDPEEVANCFKEVAELVFRGENLLANITCEGKDYSQLEEKTLNLSKNFPNGNSTSLPFKFDPIQTNEAFITASTVQYVGKGANLFDLGYKYSGKFEVLKSVLRTGYLWEKVRVQGGAYGSMIGFDYFTGDLGLVSYRDPNLMETLNIYDEIADFLEQLELDRDELEKIIIGCVGHLDPPLTEDRKGSIAKVEFLTGINQEFKQKRLEDLLQTQLEDIKGFAPLFREVKKSGKVCVLGNEDKIKKSSEQFDELVQIFK